MIDDQLIFTCLTSTIETLELWIMWIMFKVSKNSTLDYVQC